MKRDQNFPNILTPLWNKNKELGGEGFLPDDSFIYQGSFVLCKNK
jgi:hypothetical protein